MEAMAQLNTPCLGVEGMVSDLALLQLAKEATKNTIPLHAQLVETTKSVGSTMFSGAATSAPSQLVKEAIAPTVKETMSDLMTHPLAVLDFSSQWLTHAMKETAEKGIASGTVSTTSKVVSGAKSSLLSGTAKETAKKGFASGTASTASKVMSGAKFSLLLGAAIEGASFAYTAYSSYKQMESGEISEAEYKQEMIKKGGKGAGSCTGSTFGGIIGSFIPIPIVGTVLGGIAGGILGGYLGEKIGEKAAGEKAAEDVKPTPKGAEDGMMPMRIVIPCPKDDSASEEGDVMDIGDRRKSMFKHNDVSTEHDKYQYSIVFAGLNQNFIQHTHAQ